MTQLPTKKQKQILDFITSFTAGNGYGPSYREVMQGLGYKSVSTVAVHIDSLISKGYLRKGSDYSARSLEVTTPSTPQAESAGMRYLREAESKLRQAGSDDEADILVKAIAVLDNQRTSSAEDK